MNGLDYILTCLQALGNFAQEEPILRVLLLLLGAMFIWSGLSKIRRPVRAAASMVQFRVLKHANKKAGFSLGAVEFGLGLWLVSGVEPSYALLAAAFLFLLFSFVIVRSLLHGERFACYCLGSDEDEISYWSATRNLVLCAGAGALGAATLGGQHTVISLSAPEIIAACAIGYSVVLIASLPKLLRWNQDLVRYLHVLTEPE